MPKKSETSKKSLAKQANVEEKVEQVAEEVATDVVTSLESTNPTPDATPGPVSVVTDDEHIDEQVARLTENMKHFAKTVRDTMSLFQTELKNIVSQSKKLRRKSRKRLREHKTPNGFTKTLDVSPVMLEFCGQEPGTQMSRNQVNNFIHTYIREHNLQNPNNKRQIVPDKKLKSILNLSKLRSKAELVAATKAKGEKNNWTPEHLESELTKITEKETVNYFNLQRLLNHHYV